MTLSLITHLVQSYGFCAVFTLIARLNATDLTSVWTAVGGLLWAGFYAFSAYALGSAASGVGSTITIVGYAVAGVLTVASIVVGRRSLRRLEQRAEEAFPEEQAARQAPQFTVL
jgi:hypothetical protein